MIRCTVTTAVIVALTIWFSASPNAFADPQDDNKNQEVLKEPRKPDVDTKLDPEKEARADFIAGLSPADAFAELKSHDVKVNRKLMYKAIFKAFNTRKAGAIALAQNHLKAPLIEVRKGKRVSRVQEFTVAKRIFEVFPEEATVSLLTLYQGGDATTRGNVISALGNVAGAQRVRKLLVEALDDTTPYQDEDPASLGDPLRLCDMAYNQLVLRYNIRGVLRTISPAHTLDVRDHHINLLTERFSLGTRPEGGGPQEVRR